MKHKTITLYVLLMSLLSFSCTKQFKAEGVVKDFIEQNAVSPDKFEDCDFASIDSTKHINDSIILSMQTRGNELFKSDINYAAKTGGRMMYFIRMKYVYDGDSLQNTFYLDEQLEHVVSFK